MSEEIARIRELLSYDPESGKLFWLQDREYRVAAGDEAGSVTKSGYVNVKVCRMMYRAHRIAFALMVGRWPTKFIDHINGNPTDNRWCNLREADNSQNMANRRMNKNNGHGLKGVKFNRGNKRYEAAIQVNKRQIYLGLFSTAEEAHAAYVAAAIKYRGEFARAA